MGDVVAAVDRYRDIPAPVRATLKARMAARQYDEIVSIRRDRIEGRARYDAAIRDMHFGTGQICGTVTRARWTDSAQERGLVYCESGHCLLVPTVCRNVSRITRQGPAVAGAGGEAGAGAGADAGGAAAAGGGIAPAPAPAPVAEAGSAPASFADLSAALPADHVAELSTVPDAAGATPRTAGLGDAGPAPGGSFAQGAGGAGGSVGLVVGQVAAALIGGGAPQMQISAPGRGDGGLPDGGAQLPAPTPPVPEPASALLLLAGLAALAGLGGLAGAARRSRSARG